MTAPASPAMSRILLPVALGTVVAPLDTAVNIAFPAITSAFGLPVAAIQWVVISYVLTYGSLMLGVGRLGDIFGHGRVFRAGLAVSAAAFLACALAPSFAWLLAGRVLQGIGAALVIGCGVALATLPFPDARRGRVLALYTTVFGAGAALGPMLGGVLVQEFGWQAVFWARAPVALAALLFMLRNAHVGNAHAAPRDGAREPFDLAGAALLAASIATLLLAINQLHHASAQPWRPALLALGFGVSLALFLWRSATAPRPVIRLHHFRSMDFALANLASVLVNLAGFAVLLLVPFWLSRVAGLAEGWAGLVLAVSPAGSMAAALAGGRALARVAPLRLSAIGAALTGAGLLLIGGWERETAVTMVAFALLLHGAGLGLFQLAITDLVTGTMPREDRGVAGSLAQMTRTLGVVGAASLLALLHRVLEQEWMALAVPEGDAFMRAFRVVFLITGLLALGAAALAALRTGRCARGGLR
ncbi:MAG TPA: MFS transporter [Acetobacteraceae bacterium]|nr:MFS transporter [Acetobacteraceae bacterium]